MENMINLETLLIEGVPSYEECGKYLRTQYGSNVLRFESRFLEPLQEWLTMNDVENHEDVIQLYKTLWLTSEPYSYKQAFEIKDNAFMAMVFAHISVPEMIANMGSKRIATAGIDLVNKVFNNNVHQDVPMTQVYELHEVDGELIGATGSLFAIKCWCTSTNTEHWLWIDNEVAEMGDPLQAIASTCVYYKPMQGKIKHIIRQGDVFLFEMKEPVEILGTEETVRMTKEEYFSLLKSQS